MQYQMNNDENVPFKLNKLTSDLSHVLPNLQADLRNTNAAIEAAHREIRKEKEEQIQREKDTVELLSNLLNIAKEKPETIQQIQTLIQNSNVQNVQSVASGSYGVQNVTNNSGLQVEDYLKLIESVRELTPLLNPTISQEVEEVVEDMEGEVQSNAPKKGILKASLSYLKNLFNDVIADPTRSILKAQYTDFAKEKSATLVQGIEELIKNSL